MGEITFFDKNFLRVASITKEGRLHVCQKEKWQQILETKPEEKKNVLTEAK